MTTSTIISLIMALAPVAGVNPELALAVARHESSLNPNVIGKSGEIGIMQIMPRSVKGYTKKQLRDPVINIWVGLNMLKKAQDTCIHKKNLTYLVCYNMGPSRAKKLKHPEKYRYVIVVKKELKRNLASLK